MMVHRPKISSIDQEVNSGADEFDNEEVDSGMDAEAETTPSPPVTSQPETRDAPSQSDTDKSIQQVGSEKRGLPNEKMEDSANSLSETNGLVSGNISRKSLGIKIKSRGLGSSSMSPCSNTEPVKGDRIEKKDTESLHQESIYNEQELKAALEVIRKVMKMDAAEPFNAPVNPVALGIPDYFDVIDTPMDFGTICSNLEKGVKYKNSEDVFNDVQYIWNNCYKYNNKGDYIVELMKRVFLILIGSEGNPVKDPTPSSEADTPVNGGALNLLSKKFHGYDTVTVNERSIEPRSKKLAEITMKGWDAISWAIQGTEGYSMIGNANIRLSNRKNYSLDMDASTVMLMIQITLISFRLKKHKEGCQCAICVMMRRRQEREEIARLMGGTEGSDDSLGEDIKPEGPHGDSPFGEYASSNMENSPDADAEMERKGQEMKLGHVRNFYTQQNEDTAVAGKQGGSQDLQLSHRSGDENGMRYLAPHIGAGGTISDEIRKEMPKQNDDGSTAIDQQRPKESLDKNQRAKMLENLRYLENPMLLELYGTLFADNSVSFWNGPHSLVGGHNQGSNRRSSFHSAISSLMK
ncbi:hypothetical protein DH2020_036148 [Rehmannia glutinosa]|uniref:Bromo domain-containing protein n=1 Tax=Rehmannia glutinosa TaxID=99300 RepID=A0ABR0V689_REHGL